MRIKNVLLVYIFAITSLGSFAQAHPHEYLGNIILKAVVENDAALFKTLIIPEEAVWDNLNKIYASQWTKKERQQAYLELPENYRNTVEKDFMLKFNLMVSKVEFFNLDLESLEYEILKEQDSYDKQMGVKRIFGTIDHPKFKYFSFGMIAYKDNYYLVDSRVDISEVDKYSERNFINNVVMSANHDGGLQSYGKFKIDSRKMDNEIFQCIADNLILYGVQETYIAKKENTASFIKGTWQHPYRINDGETYVGMVRFDFEYNLNHGILTYTFDNYQHISDGSDYNSLGIMPFKYNKRVAKIFKQNDYYEMLYDIRINVKSAIKFLRQATDKCISN